MKILLKTEKNGQYEPIEVEEYTSIEDLAVEHQPELPYRILAARQNYKLVDLREEVEEGDKVELLDMRQPGVNMVYQHSLCLLYLKAVNDVMGNVAVDIENSLSKGLFTKIHSKEVVSDEQLAAIEKRMHELVDADITIDKDVIPRDEAIDMLVKEGHKEKAKILINNDKMKRFKFFSIEGYKNFFYDLMVPSTGYLEYFDLKKYKNGVILRFPYFEKPNEMVPYTEEKQMYNAFAEATAWGNLMEISYVSDLNDKIDNGSYKELIQLSEALHEKKVAEIADQIKESGKRIVLIAGPSSSGKTTFAKRLCIQLKVVGLKPLYLSTDDYFVERELTPKDENGEYDFENLSCMDVDLFCNNMNDLLTGKEVDLPIFDFLDGHKHFGQKVTTLEKNQIIVVEGIHALNEAMTPAIDKKNKFKIYISPLTQINIDDHNRIPTTDARMLRRIVRDYKYRNFSAQQTIKNWPKVRAGENKNIFPYNGEADVFFNSVHIYELAVLKKYAVPLLEEISRDCDEYSEAVRMLKYLRYIKSIDDDSIIVNNSILREFIGGSIFV